MSIPHVPPRHSLSRSFDLTVFVLGLILLAWSLMGIRDEGWHVAAALLLGVPLVVIIARFPIVLDGDEGGIEIGFDSSILMFLLCTLDARSAVAVWAIGVVATQVLSGKRTMFKLFNIGVGILAGGFSAVVLHLIRSSETGTPRELLAVVVAAAAYFATDYVVSAVSVALETGTKLSPNLIQPGTWLAVACFVPFDLFGYLGAVVARNTPWWTVSLLVVPLVALLVATRALTRGRENARRLTVLLDAAVRAQTLHEHEQVVEALLEDGRRLVGLRDVTLRHTPPEGGEIGAQVRRGREATWVVAPAQDRARSTRAADQQALDALAAVAGDAFARLQLTEDLVHFARHDPLTDLPNRGILLDRVAHALHVAKRRGARVALLFIDLDGFKPVNDRFGHATGDAVLVEVGQRLLACIRESDTVARLGGDEFAVLLEDSDEGQVHTICDRILESLAEGATISGHNIQLGASIGVAYGDGFDTGEGLLRKADLAMYEAKGRGKARSVEYDPAIGRARLKRLELTEELRTAIGRGDIQVAYQPVVDTQTGRIEGVEALARWTLDGTDVPTGDFIRIAEETGLVVPLGDAILAIVAEDAARLRAAADWPFTMGVNVSAAQLREPAFVTSVERAVHAMGKTGLLLEITERQEIGQDPAVLAAMRTISEMGVLFAIDDFGVGFSSISYLQDVPANLIKVDASLSQNIDCDDRACALLGAIAAMGQALGVDVVVEGIERQSQLDLVRDVVRAPYAQGFLLHRPMPLEQVLAVVRANGTIGRGRGGAAGGDVHRDESELVPQV